MKIVVVGMGYVGLSNSVLLAQHNEVICVDISKHSVDALNARISPIIDSEISEVLIERSEAALLELALSDIENEELKEKNEELEEENKITNTVYKTRLSRLHSDFSRQYIKLRELQERNNKQTEK